MKKLIYFIIAIWAVGCTKDETTDGPKAFISLINAALGSDSVYLELDGKSVNSLGVAFGDASSNATGTGTYLETAPGVQSTTWKVGGATVSEGKFLAWNSNAYYTMVHYDTVKGNSGSLLILTDAPQLNDSVGRVRFINCYAGGDSISVWMRFLGTRRDTIKVATKLPFIERNNAVSRTFNANIRPGEYEMNMLSRDSSYIFSDTVLIESRSLYSIIGLGEQGGTGDRAPHLKLVLQLK